MWIVAFALAPFAIGEAPAPMPATVTADREALVRVMGDLNSGFVCPQFLPSDAARRDEIEQFSLALAEIGLSYEDAIKVRRAILTRHHCLGRSAPST